MDGRFKSLLVGSVLFSIVGCGFFRDKRPAPPMGGTGEPPLGAMSMKPIVEKPGKEGPVGVEMLVTLADVRLQAAADANKTTADREALCNDVRIRYQQVLEREPKNLGAMLGMARMYAVVKDKEKCIEWYQRASKTHPTNAEVPYEEGKVLGAHFKDKEATIECLHAATKIDPQNRTYRKELGFSLAWSGRYEEAYAWISRVKPEAEARYTLAVAMKHNGHIDQAKQQLALSLQADPNYEPCKQALASLNEPTDKPVQTVSAEESTPLPAPSPLSMAPAASQTPAPLPLLLEIGQPTVEKKPARPAAIQSPDPLPLNPKQDAISPFLTPTNGWDR